MQSRTFNQNGSVVFRFRLSFFLIFCALVAFGLFSQAKLFDISEQKDDLTNRAFPVFVRAQELVSLLSTQTQQIRALRDIDTTADFDEIARIAQRRQNQLALSIASYQTLTTTEGLIDTAGQLFASTTSLIEHQTHRQMLVRQRARQLGQLHEIGDAIETQIEGLRLDTLTEFQDSIDQIAIDPSMVDRVARLSVQLNSLISLGLLVEKMQDLAENGSHGEDLTGSATVREDIRFNLREILGLLNRLPESNAKTFLTANLIRARALTSQETGILYTSNELSIAQDEITQLVVDGLGLVQRIEAGIADSVTAASAGAQNTSLRLAQSIKTLSALNRLMVVFFVVGLMFVILFLVEQQLNRRLQSLRQSVRQFSEGNYNDFIEVRGRDELGEVANALRISQGVARDLERSNADLKSFAYAASHDLKTPLRAINDLAKWTLEDARDDLSPEHQQNLELLTQRSERLSSLLDGLLSYAIVDGMSDQSQNFDLVAECEAIADLLDPNGMYPVLVDTPCPQFSAAVVPLRQILTNLLSNAMKHHDKPTGTINVSAVLSAGFVEIEVEDDGPGIPAKYHADIFELFHKLESADVVEGSGIGLSLVKKLAERHSGDVYIRSNQHNARGTLFSVMLFAGPALATKS